MAAIYAEYESLAPPDDAYVPFTRGRNVAWHRRQSAAGRFDQDAHESNDVRLKRLRAEGIPGPQLN